MRFAMSRAQTNRHNRRGSFARPTVPILILICLHLLASPARAWGSHTHRLITRLAVKVLPPSELKTFFLQNEKLLERFSVEPDSKLKKRYGEAERRRHYIDIDNYGADPFSKLNPSLAATGAKFGAAKVARWGTLPWTIDEFADRMAGKLHAQSRRECAAILRLSGYLGHYVGDSTQPLHSTSHFDGFASDRGVHHRLEDATDHDLSRLETLAQSASEVRKLDSVWNAEIAELSHSHALVMTMLEADRAARAQASRRVQPYERELMKRNGTLIAGQISRAASLLASIWIYEWDRAGHPPLCQVSPLPHRTSSTPVPFSETTIPSP